MAKYEKADVAERKNKKMRQTQHPEVTEMLDLWVRKVKVAKIHISGDILQQKWMDFANQLGIPEDECLKLSDGWLTSYKAPMGLKEFKQHGNAASVNMTTVEEERKRLKEIIAGYAPHDTYNIDETGFFYVSVLYAYLLVLTYTVF